MFVICFISQSMKRSEHGLFVFPPKRTLIRRRHCSISQSCRSMTSKRFLESSSGMKFFQPSFRLTNQKRRAFVSVRQTNQIALFPFVCCFCFVRTISFQGHTKIALCFWVPSYDLFPSAREALGSLRNADDDSYKNVT